MIEEQIQKILESESSSFEDFEKFAKEFAEAAHQPRTKEQIVEEVFERLKATYLEKNPYSPTNRLGDNFSQWNFEHSNSMNRLKNVLAENGREDLLVDFEIFVKEQEAIVRKEKEQAVVEKLLKVGIDLDKVQDPEVRKYILYKELGKYGK